MTLRFGSILPGPEAQLIDQALAVGMGGLCPAGSVALREPMLEGGTPDVVVLRPRRDWDPAALAFEIDRQHTRLLHLIHTQNRTTLERLAVESAFDRSALPGMIGELVDAGLVSMRVRGGIAAEPVTKAFGLARIIAIEAKVDDWKTCLGQAVRNTWFASDSYMLLPAQRCSDTVLEPAEAAGIGVLGFMGNRVQVLVRPERSNLPRSYASWLFSGWLRRVNADD